jgi:hypothetical protein
VSPTTQPIPTRIDRYCCTSEISIFRSFDLSMVTMKKNLDEKNNIEFINWKTKSIL